MSLKKGLMYVFIANVINLLISLFTGFVLPKYLSIETYSSIKLFQLYTTYIGIVHLGFADGMYLFHGGKKLADLDKQEVADEFKTFKVFQLIVTIVSIIIAIAIKNEMLLYCAIVILPINIGSYIRELYQAIGEFKRYSDFTNINTLLIFIINLILLLIVKTDNYQVYIIAYIVAYFAYWLIIERENKKLLGKFKAKADKKYLERDIKSGFFLMIGNFCNVIFTTIDRIFVQTLLGAIKFAFYSFAVSVENLMNVFITPISTVMYNYLCNNKEKEKVIKIKKTILIFATVIITVIFPAKFIVDIWIIKYEESLTVLFLLFAAQYMSIMVRCVHINLYKAERKQKRYFIIMVLIVIVSIILNVILYYLYNSMEMIALATVLTTIIWFIVGEIDFKEYRLSIKDYIYTFAILIGFLICGKVNNALIGMAIYIIGALILMIIFMRDSLIYFTKEAKKFIMNKLNKDNNIGKED